jgi:Major Facilitator Superfamily
MAEPAPPAAAFEYPPLRGGKLLFLTAAIATASFMEILDMTIVNVSVPAISGSLGVSTSEGTWAISSYMLAAAVMQPMTGWIARRFGEVRTFVLRLATSFAFCVFAFSIFWAASLNDTASFGQFATPRFLQGLGVAFFFLPLNQIMLSGIPPRDLASASGLSNFMRTMAGSIATAVTVLVWNRRTDYHHAVLSEHIRNSAGAWTQYQSELTAPWNRRHGRVSICRPSDNESGDDLGGQRRFPRLGLDVPAVDSLSLARQAAVHRARSRRGPLINACDTV